MQNTVEILGQPAVAVALFAMGVYSFTSRQVAVVVPQGELNTIQKDHHGARASNLREHVTGGSAEWTTVVVLLVIKLVLCPVVMTGLCWCLSLEGVAARSAVICAGTGGIRL